MEHTNDYQFREWLGRAALKDLQLKKLFPKYDITYTGDYYSIYDAYFTGNEDKKVFVEIKVRDRVYGDYILEYKKCKSLNYIATSLYLKDTEATFLYINFCMEATYIWNINRYVYDYKNVKWTNDLKMNKATSTSRDESDKENKDKVLLLPSDGKIIDYKINKIKLYNDEQERLKPRIKRSPGMFD